MFDRAEERNTCYECKSKDDVVEAENSLLLSPNTEVYVTENTRSLFSQATYSKEPHPHDATQVIFGIMGIRSYVHDTIIKYCVEIASCLLEGK